MPRHVTTPATQSVTGPSNKQGVGLCADMQWPGLPGATCEYGLVTTGYWGTVSKLSRVIKTKFLLTHTDGQDKVRMSPVLCFRMSIG